MVRTGQCRELETCDADDFRCHHHHRAAAADDDDDDDDDDGGGGGIDEKVMVM